MPWRRHPYRPTIPIRAFFSTSLLHCTHSWLSYWEESSSQDIQVWRVVILAVLVVDVAMLASNYASLKQQNRLSLGGMRSADWSNILFTGLVTAIRIFFLAGVGVRNVKSKKT